MTNIWVTYKISVSTCHPTKSSSLGNCGSGFQVTDIDSLDNTGLNYDRLIFSPDYTYLSLSGRIANDAFITLFSILFLLSMLTPNTF